MILTRLSSLLYRTTPGWSALLATAAFVLFVSLVLPSQAELTTERLGGTPTPDISLHYSSQDLYEMADSFGEDGRSEYIRARWSFDLIWPLVYLVFLTSVISWALRTGVVAESRVRLLNLVPLLAATLDLSENVILTVVMTRYPERTPLLDVVAGPITSAKWLFVSVSFIILMGAITARQRSRWPFDRPRSVG